MTKTTGKRNHGPVLVAALTVLGASLGVSTPAGAASDTTGIWVKDQATSNQHKSETTSSQYKEHAPSAMFLKLEPTKSHQIKGEAPSAKFLKLDATKSRQIKGETHSNQLKLDTPNESH